VLAGAWACRRSRCGAVARNGLSRVVEVCGEGSELGGQLGGVGRER
jgi:hypothetical protein